MAAPTLRPDITAARASARFSLGSGRELRQLESLLSPDETVAAMAQCRYQGCFGLAVITDTRFLFLCHGLIWRVNEDIGLDRIALVQWHTVLGLGTLTLHIGAVPLEFTGLSRPGGAAVVQGLRRHVAAKDRLDRQAREGILALAAPVSARWLKWWEASMPTLFFMASAWRHCRYSRTPPGPLRWCVRPSKKARFSTSGRSRLNFAVARAADVETIFWTCPPNHCWELLPARSEMITEISSLWV